MHPGFKFLSKQNRDEPRQNLPIDPTIKNKGGSQRQCSEVVLESFVILAQVVIVIGNFHHPVRTTGTSHRRRNRLSLFEKPQMAPRYLQASFINLLHVGVPAVNSILQYRSLDASHLISHSHTAIEIVSFAGL